MHIKTRKDFENQKKYNLVNLKNFIGVAPKLNELKASIKVMKDKETIIYKILLDILGSYIRLFYGKDSSIYQKKYLPCAIEFYDKIEYKLLSKVCSALMESLRIFDDEIDECLMKRFM